MPDVDWKIDVVIVEKINKSFIQTREKVVINTPVDYELLVIQW